MKRIPARSIHGITHIGLNINIEPPEDFWYWIKAGFKTRKMSYEPSRSAHRDPQEGPLKIWTKFYKNFTFSRFFVVVVYSAELITNLFLYSTRAPWLCGLMRPVVSIDLFWSFLCLFRTMEYISDHAKFLHYLPLLPPPPHYICASIFFLRLSHTHLHGVLLFDSLFKNTPIFMQ